MKSLALGAGFLAIFLIAPPPLTGGNTPISIIIGFIFWVASAFLK